MDDSNYFKERMGDIECCVARKNERMLLDVEILKTCNDETHSDA